jgi:hypothetical protein
VNANLRVHLHPCSFAYLGGYEERCKEMFECIDSCTEHEESEKHGFCPEHEKMAQELEAIMKGKL